MEVSIGIRNAPREITLEIAGEPTKFASDVAAKIKDGEPLQLTDVNGRTVVVPLDALGYVLVGDTEGRRVGFAL